MTSDQVKAIAIATGALAVGFVAYKVYSMGIAKTASAAVGAVGDLASGTVVGLGTVVGIPETDQTRCIRAKANGETFEASKYCAAGDFIAWVWAGRPANSGMQYADRSTADLFAGQDEAFK